VRAIGAEQSNVSIIVDEHIMLKIYRRLRSGVQPELEMARFLTEVARYPNTPEFLGAAEHITTAGDRTALAIAFAFVPNQGDAWNAVVETLDRALEDLALLSEDDGSADDLQEALNVFPLNLAGRLGERTAELHRALTTSTSDPAFAAEPVSARDLERWSQTVREEAECVLDQLERTRESLSEVASQQVGILLEARSALKERVDKITTAAPMGAKIRIHGDYHLGQVLVSKDDVIIIDFEGEPGRTLAERREKSSPLRDVAGMLRSLDYAASAAVDRFASRTGGLPDRVLAAATAWRNCATRDFLEGYADVAKEMSSYPADKDVAASMLDLFLLQKAFYEIAYEAANRPTWLSIPLRSVLDLLMGSEARAP
jgi:maltose alpha-D-glucosyltransferase/alpha-amylase